MSRTIGAGRSRGVLFVVPNILSFTSFLRPLALRLGAAGRDVHCACDTDALWPGSDRGGVTLHHVAMPRGMQPGQHLAAASALRRIVAAVRPEFVHAHFSASIFTVALAKASSWPRIVGTFHGVTFPAVTGPRRWIVRAAETAAARRLDHVWVLSDDDVASLKQVSRRIAVTRHPGFGLGCDTHRFDARLVTAQERHALRLSMGIGPADFVFTFVGRFTAFKGYSDVVRAFLRLSQRRAGVKLLLVGSLDPLHDSGLTPAETQQLAAAADVIDAGWQADVRNYLAISNGFVFPSRREGMPVCVMEALSMGVPVITRDSRGCREIVRDKVNGTVLSTCTPERLADAMEQMIANPSLHAALARGALASRELFSRDTYVEHQINEYVLRLAAQDAGPDAVERINGQSLS